MARRKNDDKPNEHGVRFGHNVRIQSIPRMFHGAFVANAFNVVCGRSGASKSTLCATLAADATKHGGIVLASMKEDADFVFMARVLAAGGDPSKLALAADADWIFPRDIDKLDRAMEEIQPSVVILDTAAKHLSMPVSSPKVSEPCKLLDKLARKYGVPIIAVTHTIKSVSKNGEPLDAVGGSTGGLVGSARAVGIFGVTPEDSPLATISQRSMVMAKDSYGPAGRVLLFGLDSDEIRDEDTGEYVDAAYLTLVDEDAEVYDPRAYAMELIRGGITGKRGPAQSERKEAKAFLIETLSFGPVPVNGYEDDQHGHVDGLKELAKSEGLSWASLRRASDEEGVVKFKDGYQGPWVWRLPDDHSALPENIESTTEEE